MGWEILRVTLPLFWPVSCSTNIHEIAESVSSRIEKVEYADHSLYRRHVNNRSNQKGGRVDQGHSHLPSATFRVSSQFKEICTSSMSGNRISRPYSKFCEFDSLDPLTEGAEGPGGVYKDVQQGLNIDFGIDQTLVVNHPNSCTSSLTNSESSTVRDTVSEIQEFVSYECEIDSLSERGTALVDVELAAFKWEALHPESSRPGVDSDRCLKKGMGSSMQRS